jgi:NADH-quinone oxidoreductase subunit K
MKATLLRYIFPIFFMLTFILAIFNMGFNKEGYKYSKNHKAEDLVSDIDSSNLKFFDYFTSDTYIYIFLNILFLIVIFHLATSYINQNILRILFLLEIIILLASFIFLIIGLHYGDIYGQLVVLHLLTIAAVEAAIGLALIYSYYRLWRTVKIGTLSKIKG